MANAFSAEPGRTTAYSDDIRWRVIWQRLVREMSFSEIAKNLNIAMGTTHNIWSRFMLTGDVSAKKQPPRYKRRKLNEYEELLLTGLILEQPQLYISEMRKHIHDVIGLEVSNTTICRILGKHGFTRKKIRQVAQQSTGKIQSRDEFLFSGPTGMGG